MNLIVNGCKIHAANGGRKIKSKEPAVLLIHGAGMDCTVWQLQTRWIAYKKRTVFAIDLPGHGKSQGKCLKNINEMADWLICFLDALNISKVAIVGHSMGGFIALDFAARYPHRVRALALLGVSTQMVVHPELLAAAQFNSKNAANLICDWGYSGWFHIGGNPVIGAWAIGTGKKILECSGAGVLATDLLACNSFRDTKEAARNILCPTLCILGQEDKMISAHHASSLTSLIPNCKVLILEKVGHMIMNEAPSKTNEALVSVI